MTGEPGTGGPSPQVDPGSSPENQPGTGQPEPAGDGARVAELAREAGSYRTQRNVALRQAAAYRTILQAHNIDLSGVTDAALEALPINAGQVDGVFPYEPPRPGANVQRVEARAAQPDGPAALTREQIEAMPPDEINRRWDEVKAFLRRA